MHSSRKGLTMEETIAELYSDPFSDISDLESSDSERVDSSDSENSSIDVSESEISEQSDIETVDGWSTRDKTPNLGSFLGVHHHVYQDNFYNSVNLAENLLKRNIRVCGKMTPNKGIPKNLEKVAKGLKKGQSSFRRVMCWCRHGRKSG